MAHVHIHTIADKVKDILAAETFSQTVSWSRTWLPEYDLEDTENAWIGKVVPEALPRVVFSRGAGSSVKTQQDYRIHVGVMHNLDPADNDEADAANVLLMEVVNVLDRIALTGINNILWVRTSIVTPAEPTFLREKGTWLGITAIEFRGMDSKA